MRKKSEQRDLTGVARTCDICGNRYDSKYVSNTLKFQQAMLSEGHYSYDVLTICDVCSRSIENHINSLKGE